MSEFFIVVSCSNPKCGWFGISTECASEYIGDGENLYSCPHCHHSVASRVIHKDSIADQKNEVYPPNWKHCTIHLNPKSGEMHSDGDHTVRLWIEDRIKSKDQLKDIESFCIGRMKMLNGINPQLRFAFRDVCFLVRQHLSGAKKGCIDVKSRVTNFLTYLRLQRDLIKDDPETRHYFNEACDRLDVLDNKLNNKHIITEEIPTSIIQNIKNIGKFCDSCNKMDTGYVCPKCGIPVIESRTQNSDK